MFVQILIVFWIALGLATKQGLMEEKNSNEKSKQENSIRKTKIELEQAIPIGKAEDTNAVLEILNRPWKLIKEGGKLGINGIKHFFIVFFLFTTVNIILFVYALNRLFIVDFELSKIPYVVLIFVLGLLTTLYALRRAYQYILIDTIRVIYENLSSLFHKITDYIIDKVEDTFDVEVDLSESKLTKALDFGIVINSTYDKIPKFLRKGIIRVLNKVPFVGMLIDLKEDLMKGNKVEASMKLYDKMDGFIGETIFEDNNTKWIWWLLPLNILILGLIIHFNIGAIAY